MNLFPGTEGILTPEWEVECPDGSIDEDSMDSDVMFDPNMCMTTCGCIKNAVSFEQKFVLTNDFDPEWDSFHQILPSMCLLSMTRILQAFPLSSKNVEQVPL